MHYELHSKPTAAMGECLVIGIFSDNTTPVSLSSAIQKKVQLLGSTLSETGTWAFQTEIEQPSLLVIHCGNTTDFNGIVLRKCLSEISTLLMKQPFKKAVFCLPAIATSTTDEQIQLMLLYLDSLFYQLLDFKTQNKKPYALECIGFYLPSATPAALSTAEAIAKGITLTRKLSDLPANHCTPTTLSQEAHALEKQHPQIKVKTFNPQEIKTLGMNALLAVAQGSAEPPCFIEASYQGGNAGAAPIILVGKGITFDSGGLSLKPANVMDEMKYDMAGAASVLGTLQACAMLKLPLNVIGLIPSAENLPGGTAVKPGDIITTMSGQTVEILNTDAEGRLILADALTYAERFNPEYVIDIATLTGAIIVALGHVMTGLMTNDDSLAALILDASAKSQDRCWRLPLDDAYQEALDSPLADMINAGFDRSAGSLTAACFLSRFTKKYCWAHLDVAGTAWNSGKKRHATGRPVPLLVTLLQQLAYAH